MQSGHHAVMLMTLADAYCPVGFSMCGGGIRKYLGSFSLPSYCIIPANLVCAYTLDQPMHPIAVWTKTLLACMAVLARLRLRALRRLALEAVILQGPADLNHAVCPDGKCYHMLDILHATGRDISMLRWLAHLGEALALKSFEAVVLQRLADLDHVVCAEIEGHRLDSLQATKHDRAMLRTLGKRLRSTCLKLSYSKELLISTTQSARKLNTTTCSTYCMTLDMTQLCCAGWRTLGKRLRSKFLKLSYSRALQTSSTRSAQKSNTTTCLQKLHSL